METVWVRIGFRLKALSSHGYFQQLWLLIEILVEHPICLSVIVPKVPLSTMLSPGTACNGEWVRHCLTIIQTATLIVFTCLTSQTCYIHMYCRRLVNLKMTSFILSWLQLQFRSLLSCLTFIHEFPHFLCQTTSLPVTLLSLHLPHFLSLCYPYIYLTDILFFLHQLIFLKCFCSSPSLSLHFLISFYFPHPPVPSSLSVDRDI